MGTPFHTSPPAEVDAQFIPPPRAVRSITGYQCRVEVHRNFFHAPQGYYDVVLQALPDNINVGVG